MWIVALAKFRHYALIDARNTRIDPAEEPTYADTLRYPCAIYLGSRPTLFRDSTTFASGTIPSAASAAPPGPSRSTPIEPLLFRNSITGNKNAARNGRHDLRGQSAGRLIHYIGLANSKADQNRRTALDQLSVKGGNTYSAVFRSIALHAKEVVSPSPREIYS